MPDRPANLQVAADRKRTTVRDVAQQLQISERNVYKVREIMRLGRDDLLNKMAADEISVHAAWLDATGRSAPSPRDRLRAAWTSAPTEVKAEFIAWIWDQFGGPDD